MSTLCVVGAGDVEEDADIDDGTRPGMGGRLGVSTVGGGGLGVDTADLRRSPSE
jgi:hypothetical protein